MQLKIGGEE